MTSGRDRSDPLRRHGRRLFVGRRLGARCTISDSPSREKSIGIGNETVSGMETLPVLENQQLVESSDLDLRISGLESVREDREHGRILDGRFGIAYLAERRVMGSHHDEERSERLLMGPLRWRWRMRGLGNRQ